MGRVSTLLQGVDLGVFFELGTQDSALVVGTRSRPLEEINLRLWYIRVVLLSITVDSSVGTLTSRICLFVILIICGREEELLWIVLRDAVQLIFTLSGTLLIFYYFLFTVQLSELLLIKND